MNAGFESGKLYIVATPIGNLEDMTFRAVRILKEADFVASEDTRTTRKLLSAYDIHTPLISYHEQGGKNLTGRIVSRIREGKTVALVSEAGTPGISDPGYELVRDCIAEGIEPLPVPGPSALVAALSVSDVPTHRFVFEGFLPRKGQSRLKRIEEVRDDPRTMVFYEAPKRLEATLSDLFEVLGDRRAVVARELTKKFEEVRRGTLSDLIEWSGEREVRGEVTIVVEGCASLPSPQEDLLRRMLFLSEQCGLSDRDVVKVLHEETGLPRKEIYPLLPGFKSEGGTG